jgi:hypothetical protein
MRLSPLQPSKGVGCNAASNACIGAAADSATHGTADLRLSERCFVCIMTAAQNSKPASLQGMSQVAYLLFAFPYASLALEEALYLFLGAMGHVVPHPVTGCPDTGRLAQESKVMQVFLEVCISMT